MNVQQLKDSGYIIHECIVGSHLYGTNKEGSDIDIKGVYVLPTDMILSGHYIEQISDSSQDTTYYEIGRFIKLAVDANPNILDILGSDKVIFTTDKWKEYFPDVTPYLTTELRKTFLGYAHSQIQKAKGMNKKTNWEKSRITRKTPLDFCYVLIGKEESIPFFRWVQDFNYNEFVHRKNNTWFDSDVLTNYSSGVWYPLKIYEENIGLASVNNFPNLYSMYAMNDGGIISDNSNDIQLRSIPKNANHLGYLYFSRDAYSTHCKDYKEYTEWLEKRNPLRYQDNAKVANEYDTKNIMHCIRLLYTAKDIALGKGLILARPERKQLLDIRNGKYSYNEIISITEELTEEVKKLFSENKANLPKEIDKNYIQQLLLKIRKNE